MSYYTEKLKQVLSDPLQKEAYDTDDSTVVIAGPGSGKTTILTLKIMKVLNGYIKEPQGLACLTFSREAAREFEDRLKLLGYTKRKNVFLGTVHSFCMSEILDKYANLYDCGLPTPLKIIPSNLENQIFNGVLKDLGVRKYRMTDMNKERSLNIIGVSQITVESDQLARKIADEYEKRVLEAGYIDYEIIIIYSTRLIQEHEYVRKCLSVKFPWIVIDEYQDLGRPLHEMILSLFTQTDIRIFAVGDPDQSIYGFSGAIPDYLMELYNRDDTVSVELKNNYRSNQDIIDGSETVLNIQRSYHAMTRGGESAVYRFISCPNGYQDQYKYLIQTIIPACKEQGIPLEGIAVLLGYRKDCKELAIKCMEKNIPYYIPIHDFDRTDFVKWMEECAQWINDKSKASFDEIFDYWYNLHVIHRDNKFMSEKKILQMKKDLLNILIESMYKKSDLKSWIKYFLTELGIGKLLKDSEQLPNELENLKNLYYEVSDDKYKDYDTNKFSKIGKPENQITITTRHSSKGLEFEVVVMMGMDEKHFPSWKVDKDPRAIDEENRICFVCVSRAKRVCILMNSMYYDEMDYRYGEVRTKRYYPSRYIAQLREIYGD
ncbi:ATP-dependent helicase [Clostridium estertheticum]|uniref:UvrD-helicase domain-containing protein n=1 Tax=Clostridium estertheticum TaxID=238834 RepID=UPI001C0C52DB|nr:ATP-dependent helicase [Clostridium estertheticum]MBU3175192.1 ATP-dependent helicase [Clostridium estertheticum]